MVTKFDYAIIIIYFALLLSIGFIASRRAKTKEDYLVAGRSLPLPLFTACMAAVVIGGGCTLGGTALAYKSGIAGIWVGGMYAVSIFLLAWLLNTKMKNMRIFSTNEGLGIFYGSHSRTVGALVSLIYLFMIGVLQIVAIGTILHIMLGWSTTFSMIIGGGIILCYLILGGMWAVAFTDIMQFIVMTVGVIILAPILSLIDVGGFSGLAGKLPSIYFDITSIGGERIFAYVLLLVPGFLVGQDIWQKAFTAKHPKIARRGTLLAAGYISIYAVATVIIGICLYAVNPALDNPDLAFAMAAVTFSPVGVRGLLLAAALASVMSTANGAILGASTVVFNDLISRKVKMSDKTALLANRILAGVVCFAAVVCALWIQSVLIALDIAYAYLSGCIFVPLVFAFVLKKVSARAGLFALIASSLTVTGFFIIDGITALTPIIFGSCVSAVVFFGVNAIDKKKSEITFDEGRIIVDGIPKSDRK